jgi:hypothetical protein
MTIGIDACHLHKSLAKFLASAIGVRSITLFSNDNSAFTMEINTRTSGGTTVVFHLAPGEATLL